MVPSSPTLRLLDHKVKCIYGINKDTILLLQYRLFDTDGMHCMPSPLEDVTEIKTSRQSPLANLEHLNIFYSLGRDYIYKGIQFFRIH